MDLLMMTGNRKLIKQKSSIYIFFHMKLVSTFKPAGTKVHRYKSATNQVVNTRRVREIFLFLQMKRIAPEYYDHLPSYSSWCKVLWDFVFTTSIGPFSRVRRNLTGTTEKQSWFKNYFENSVAQCGIQHSPIFEILVRNIMAHLIQA